MKVLAFLLYSSIIVSNQFVCAEVCPPDLTQCKCYPISQQIVCDDPNFDDTKLAEISPKIRGNWQYLYIHGTKIKTIKADTFTNADFVNIFIVSNELLTNIDQLAFKESIATNKLIIRDNKGLDDNVNLFAIVKKLGKSLKVVELDKNSLTAITHQAFNDEVQKETQKKLYQQLEYIRLDDQKGAKKIAKIEAGTFVDLPSLKQLSLDKNQIDTIDALGIDLSKSNLPATGHIGLFLSDNVLTEASLTTTQIKLPPHASVGLDLSNNKIANLATPFIDLVSSVAHIPGGKVYLKSTTIPKCQCDVVKKITQILKEPNAPLKDSIIGLTSMKCMKTTTEESTIDKC